MGLVKASKSSKASASPSSTEIAHTTAVQRPPTPLPTWQVLSVFLVQLCEAMNGKKKILSSIA